MILEVKTKDGNKTVFGGDFTFCVNGDKLLIQGVDMEDENNENFKKELTKLLNNYSWDNACETPDYILADYVERCLLNYCATMARNIAWHSNWKRLDEG